MKLRLSAALAAAFALCGVQIVGYYTNNNLAYGFLYSGGSFTTLTIPGGRISDATAINDAGDIVGNYYANGVSGAFVYSGGLLSQSQTHCSLPLQSIQIRTDHLEELAFSPGGDGGGRSPDLFGDSCLRRGVQRPSAHARV